jgi:hypothetical protein
MSDISTPENPERLRELISHYCAEAEKLLETAPDFPSALQLKDSLCAQFEKECDSRLVVSATRDYLDTVLKNRWNMHKHGVGSSGGHH